ncbi:MAG: hypothetical protein JJU20_05175 [Opitutales bacterium]|nr:hypothetical protein [Opitutales bacterium]
MANGIQSGLVTCRAGLEKVVTAELKGLGIQVTGTGTRAVHFETDLAGIYRANMGLRSGLNVVVPIRTFKARNYELLYFQSRKTNWHKLFDVNCNLRIDVNGGSSTLRNTEYVVHRVKDGIVDTFRKLAGGRRPSISKEDPDIHILVHLNGDEVTLSLDTSGTPLFKRGYRVEHGIAPLKEDLAAGMLQMSGWDQKSPLLDPMCGSGTFLFEAWMLAAGIPPNAHRRFGFESQFDYDSELHAAEREALLKGRRELPSDFVITGWESDVETAKICQRILEGDFDGAPIELQQKDFRATAQVVPGTFLMTNPPYGKRIGNEEEARQLHLDLRQLIESHDPPMRFAFFSALPKVLSLFSKVRTAEYTLFNGKLEGRLIVG